MLCKVNSNALKVERTIVPVNDDVVLRIPAISSQAALDIMGDVCLRHSPKYPSLSDLYKATAKSKEARKMVTQALVVKVGEGPQSDPLWNKALDEATMERLEGRVTADLRTLRDVWVQHRLREAKGKFKIEIWK